MNSTSFKPLFVCALAFVGLLAFSPGVGFAAITCSAGKIDLPDAFAGHQLVISDNGRDVTREATYSSADPSVVTVDAKGYVNAAGDGATTVRIVRGSEAL